jgi:hypothetical protein
MALTGPKGNEYRMFPNFDCTTAGGDHKPVQPAFPNDPRATAGCFEADHYVLNGKLQGRFPHVEAADFSAPSSAQK